MHSVYYTNENYHMPFTKKYLLVIAATLLVLSVHAQKNIIDLKGTWQFKLDSTDVGEQQQWFSKKLSGTIQLPGSLTTNNIGDDITLTTPWTGDIIDSSYFTKPEYAKYREPNNIKVHFWLQPTKYYKGGAWYQKEIDIPASWNKKHVTLFLERCHWETTVWVDDTKTYSQMSLAAPHVYDLSSLLSPGKHRITICIDNRVKEVNVGPNSHSISDHTQSNWNGMVGKLLLIQEPALHIESVKLFPNINKKEVIAVIDYKNDNGNSTKANFMLQATSGNKNAEVLKPF